MLGKLILILVQIAAAWLLGPVIRAQIPTGGTYDLFIYAIVFAIVVYLTGVLGAQAAAIGVGDIGPAIACSYCFMAPRRCDR